MRAVSGCWWVRWKGTEVSASIFGFGNMEVADLDKGESGPKVRREV